ncbi:hypothetical protein BDR06DRAFT_971922 [Suillus hirtellus]|nr:hypothetical protein BDR06DRAFT_971922 [Suillus hirtellus]
MELINLNPTEDLVQLTTETHSFDQDVESTLPMYHLYDCGWDDTISNASVSPEISSPMDPYDCGWEDDMNVTSLETIMPLEQNVRSNGAHPTKLSYCLSNNILCAMDALIINKMVPPNKSSTKDLYDCGWGDIMTAAALQATDENIKANADIVANSSSSKGEMITSAAPANDPYDVGWDDPMDDSNPADIASMADSYDCGWQNATALEDNIMLGDSADDPYDCGWEDPMEGPTTMQLSVDKMFYVDMDVIDLTSESPSRSVDQISNERDPIQVVAERSMSPTEPNAFQEAGKSMCHAIQQLNSIGHSDFDGYVRNIVAPGDRLVYDS